ncbi:MAG: hypothetical protein J6M06_01965 [Synergistaceae bacterium]|nr:hypothetical protein [Synergistaceae bacterium]
MADKTFLERELEKNPHLYDKPRCREFIDRQTLTHVVCNVDCPEGVPFAYFGQTLNAVAETLAIFPYCELPKPHLILPCDLADGDTVWLELFDHGLGKYCVFPCTVKWQEESGICFVDAESYGHYGAFKDFNKSRKAATFGWRCWSDCPEDAQRDATPWK